MQQASAECAAVEELCVGSKRQPVCDLQGTMLLCNDDGTVRSQEMCASAKLCQAGIAIGVCAACLADMEYRCTDKALEVCGSDGMSFTVHQECETAALCNASIGTCTDATCVPNVFNLQSRLTRALGRLRSRTSLWGRRGPAKPNARARGQLVRLCGCLDSC